MNKETIKEKFTEAQANDNTHIMDRMLDITYALTTKMPLFGKFAKKSLDKMDALNRAKAVSSKVFKPFFPFPKVDKKHTEKFVEEKEKTEVKTETKTKAAAN
jgi:hypothetical protein